MLRDMMKINSSVLQEIYRYNIPYNDITSDQFVKFVLENLQRNSTCLHTTTKGMHKHSSKCNERLCMLSAVQACFAYNADKKMNTDNNQLSEEFKYNCLPKFEILQADNHSELNKKNIRIQDESAVWYNQACNKLAKDVFLLELLSLQEKVQCIFASHIIKKIIILCAIQHNQTAFILRYIGDTWKRTKTVCGFQLELLNSFMSNKQQRENNVARNKIYNWALDSLDLNLRSFLVKKLSYSESISFQENLLFLSFIGKLFKHSVSCGEEIPTSLITSVFDILELRGKIFFSYPKSKHTMGQFLFLRFLKSINNIISVKFCLRKARESDIAMKCEKLLQLLPTLFEMCDKNNYMETITFWGNADPSGKIKRHRSWQSHRPNIVMAREMFLLTVKASAILSCASYSSKGDVIRSIMSLWESSQAWIGKHFENKKMDSGWLPELFGDQDDKWIEALFCLLLIYQNYFHEEKNLILQDSNQSDGKDLGVCETTATMSHEDGNTTGPETFCHSICPHKFFLQFVEFICFDHLVLSDFLMSPETNFLEYFIKYLGFLHSNWADFVSYCCKQSESIEVEQNAGSHSKDVCSISDVMSANQKESVMTDLLVEQQSNKKRQKYDVLKSSSPAKLLKTNEKGVILVSYTDSDSDSSDEVSDKISIVTNYGHDVHWDEERIQQTNGNSFHTESMNIALKVESVVKASLNDDYNASKVIFDSDRDTIPDNDNVGLLESEYLLSSFPSSSSLHSSSDGECNNTLSTDENVCYSNETAGDFEKSLEPVMTMFIRLRFHIERLNDKLLFPYNADLLLKLLSLCEEKYESDRPM